MNHEYTYREAMDIISNAIENRVGEHASVTDSRSFRDGTYRLITSFSTLVCSGWKDAETRDRAWFWKLLDEAEEFVRWEHKPYGTQTDDYSLGCVMQRISLMNAF